MSYADLASSLLARNQQIDQQRVDAKAKEIAEAYLEKLKHPGARSIGTLLPDGKSFSCITYCSGIETYVQQAVATRLAEEPYGFKVDADFDYNNGNRIVISPN